MARHRVQGREHGRGATETGKSLLRSLLVTCPPSSCHTASRSPTPSHELACWMPQHSDFGARSEVSSLGFMYIPRNRFNALALDASASAGRESAQALTLYIDVGDGPGLEIKRDDKFTHLLLQLGVSGTTKEFPLAPRWHSLPTPRDSAVDDPTIVGWSRAAYRPVDLRPRKWESALLRLVPRSRHEGVLASRPAESAEGTRDDPPLDRSH